MNDATTRRNQPLPDGGPGHAASDRTTSILRVHISREGNQKNYQELTTHTFPLAREYSTAPG